MAAPISRNEAERLATLASYQILDTDPEGAFDEITRFVAKLFDVPICLISLVDRDRQWFKSSVGLGVLETPREIAFCSHTILEPNHVTVVEDASKDARFMSNPLVLDEPNIRFYAGAPLVTGDGVALGSICVIDRKPHSLTQVQQAILQKFADQIVVQLELRRALAAQRQIEGELRRSEERLLRAQSVSGTGSWEFNLSTGEISWSLKTYEIFGIDPSKGAPDFKTLLGFHHPEDTERLERAVEEAKRIGKPYELDLRVKRGPGYLHVQANGVVIFDENGSPLMLVGTVVDISDRKYAEVRLHQHANEVETLLSEMQSMALQAEEMAAMFQFSARRFESLFAGLPVACMTLDTEGTIMEWNNMSAAMLGFEAGEALFQNAIQLLVAPKKRSQCQRRFAEAVSNGGESKTVEEEFISKSGESVWVLSTSLPLLDANGNLTGIISTNVDITARKRAEAELVKSKLHIEKQHEELERANRALSSLASTDGLTGLNNHRAFQEFLQAQFERAQNDHCDLSLVILDVDNFKGFNDTFGHPAGDQVLQQVALILRNSMRGGEFVARYGGEEFAIVMPGVDEVLGLETAERLRGAIEQAEWTERSITASLGFAHFTRAVESKAALIKLADDALYESKRNGRNRVTHGRPGSARAA